MPRINSDIFIYDVFETGWEPSTIRLRSAEGYIAFHFQAKDQLAQLQQLRDLCQESVVRLAAKQAQEASIQAVLAQASHEEQKDDPDLVPVLVPLVDEIPF